MPANCNADDIKEMFIRSAGIKGSIFDYELHKLQNDSFNKKKVIYGRSFFFLFENKTQKIQKQKTKTKNKQNKQNKQNKLNKLKTKQ